MRKFHLIIIMICFHLVSIQAANAESILISTAKLVCEDKETPELVKKCKLMVYKIGESSFNLGKATAACELAKKIIKIMMVIKNGHVKKFSIWLRIFNHNILKSFLNKKYNIP